MSAAMRTAMMVWHLMKKDLRRTQWIIVALAIATAAALLHSLALPDLSACLWPCDANRDNTHIALQGSVVLLVLLLVWAVIHDDAPWAVDAYWRSQPVSAGALVAGKMLLLLTLIVVFSGGVQLLWAVLMGFSIRGSLPAIGTTVYWGASLVLLAALVGTLTRSIQTAVLTTIAMFVVLGFVFSGLIGLFLRTAFPRFGVAADFDYSSIPGVRADVWLALATLLLAATYCIPPRFVRARLTRLIAVLAVAALGLLWNSAEQHGVRIAGIPNGAVFMPLPLASLRTGASTRSATAEVRLTQTPAELQQGYLSVEVLKLNVQPSLAEPVGVRTTLGLAYAIVFNEGRDTVGLRITDSRNYWASLALPGGTLTRTRFKLWPDCAAPPFHIACTSDWWRDGQLLVTEWRNASHQPTHAQFTLTRP